MRSDDTTALHTLRDWLRYAVSRFESAALCYGHGSDNAWDEACALLLHGLSLPADRLEPFLDARLLTHEREHLRRLIDRRAAERIPSAYLTRTAWLGEHRFYVDERVIVPRSFIAELLEDACHPWIAEAGAVRRVLDLCTGSGCLAILAALAFPQARIDAADLSAAALEVAARNVADYGLAARIELIESDLFSALAGRRYDLIISNPPYVTDAAMQALPPEYRHEPRLALAAGAHGLDCAHLILAQAGAHLEPGAVLAVELGHNRAEFEHAYPQLDATWITSRSGIEGVFVLAREQLPST